MQKDRELRRISLLIGEDQYESINEKGLNLSWLLRDLVDDFLSEKKVTIEVGDETLKLYQRIVMGTGGVDLDFEPFFRDALHGFLKSRIDNMQKLEKDVFKKSEGGKRK